MKAKTATAAATLGASTIEWEPTSFTSGVTPIQESEYTEMQNMANCLIGALSKHSSDNNSSAHGIVTTQTNGFMTPDLIKRINTILSSIKSDVSLAPYKLIPKNLIVLQDKTTSGNWDKWLWCDGSNSTPDTRGKNIVGYFKGSTLLVQNQYSTIQEGSDVVLSTAAGKYMKRS